MDKNSPAESDDFSKDKSISDRQKLVAALLFGLDHHDLDESEDESQSKGPRSKSRRSITTSKKSTDSTEVVEESKTSSIASILSFIDRHIPADPQELRATPLFQTAHAAVRFQRDQYLVGPTYAAWRSRRHRPPRIIPYQRAALGHQQLRPLAAQFIPSETVIRALTPLIAYELPPAVFPVLIDATIQIVESQQQALNTVMQESLLDLLRSPMNRQAMKRSIATYNDDPILQSEPSAQTKEQK